MKKKGFTIIELLTVITIITILVGILTPGIRKAKTTAMNLKQKAQLRAVGLGLELFAFDHDNTYPDSQYNPYTGAAPYTTGAHHLAEALLGRDGKGYDPKSSNNAILDEVSPLNPYDPLANLYDREGPYVDADDMPMSQLAQVYGVGGGGSTGDAYEGDFNELALSTGATRIEAGVLTDVFRKRKVQKPFSGEVVKVGSPILYFKAKDSEYFRDPSMPLTYADNIFDWEDNAAIFDLGHFMDSTKAHPYADPANFYATDGDIVNKNLRTNPINGDPIPYNKNTYLIISAGADGLYGTKDDVYNISRK